MAVLSEGGWGPVVVGGRRRRLRRLLLVAVLAVALPAVAGAAVLVGLYRVAEGNIERVDLPALAGKDGGPLNVLVVGSDSREGLTRREIRRLNLGNFPGQRGDTVLLASVSADRRHVSVVSFPRDLLVYEDGEPRKLTETFAGGPDNVLRVLQENTGIPIHHYVEVSIPGFMSVVETVGGVEICFDRPFRDRKAGARFAAGCHDLSPEEALAYVRARQSERGDFDRMERQQTFMKALLERLVATRTVVDLPRLFSVVDKVSRHVTTDSGLGLFEMRELATELRPLATGRVPMVTVPSHPDSVDGRGGYVVAYRPGAERLYRALTQGEPVGDHGEPTDRGDVTVAVWSGGDPDAAEDAAQTLYWAKFTSYTAGRGPLDAPAVTTVYAAPGKKRAAGWVAEVLGGVVADLPEGVELPDAADVAVAVAPGTGGGSGTPTRRQT